MKITTSIFKPLLNYVSKSIDANNPVSTPRFQSWVVLIAILFQVLMFTIFEVLSFIVAIKTGIPYSISADNIVIFGMLLSHQLALVFARSKSQSIKEIKGDDATEEIIEEVMEEEIIEEIIEDEIIEEEVIEEKPIKLKKRVK